MSATEDGESRRRPAAPPPGELELARAHADELAWHELVRDQLRSLRTGLIVVGVVAVAALGIGLWALLTAQSADQTRVATQAARVRELERRVDAVEQAVARAPSAGDIAALRMQQRTLAQRVAQVQQAGTQTAAQVDALRARVQRLEQRVAALPTATATPAATP